MKYTVTQSNFSDEVNAKAKPQRIKFPNGIVCQVEIELNEKGKKVIAEDASMLQRVQQYAGKEVRKSMDTAIEAIKTNDQLAIKDNRSQETCDKFAVLVQTRLHERMTSIGKEVEKVIEDAIEHLEKTQAALTKSKTDSAVKIATSTAAIGATVAVTVASHGALTPFAGVAIARSSLAIAQEIARLATDCSQKAAVIKVELKALKVVMLENEQFLQGKKKDVKDKSMMGKLTQLKTAITSKTAKETAMAVVSGALGVESLSVKNCKKHIEDHNAYIGELDTKSKHYSAKIYELMDEGKEWEKKIKETEKLNPQKTAGLEKVLKAVEEALDKSLKSVIKVNEGIDTARQNAVHFGSTIKDLSLGVAKWTANVDIAVNAIVDIGVAIGSPDVAMEAVVSVLVAISNDAVQAAAG